MRSKPYLIPPLARWLGMQRIDLEACTSTNDEAARLARAGASHGTIVISERQTAGRGRDGHVWKSPPGGLYLSAILRPPLSVALVPPMTLAIGIGTCDAIRACGVGAQLKWPNDVLVGCERGGRGRVGAAWGEGVPETARASNDHRKIAGVLVEAQSQGGKLDTVIVGIGINLRSVDGEIAAIATSIEDEGEETERELVIERVLVHVERWIDRYIAIGLPSIIPAWHERMAFGLTARATIDGARVVGEVIGLDPEGALLLRAETGPLYRVRSGDVEVLRLPPVPTESVEPATTTTAC
jgi:BirA family transcriptional regulator, biotin operon repressor / biotin---[acetyl-CoA-carboxylase] ligase